VTLLLLTQELSYSSGGRDRHGGHWGFSPKNYHQQRQAISLLIESFWQFTAPSFISATCWRDAIS
jgi:hypothetical protein